jgi:cytoplasmic iron level regulating protein YaaA (DUF328/UPF0246 family)
VPILLPPSEGKTTPATGSPLDLSALTFPDLAHERRKMLEALITTSAREDALQLLGVGASLEDEVRRNLQLETAPTAPAREVYTGVLFTALQAHTLAEVPVATRAAVHVMSGLFGIVGLDDPIPAYRLSMGAQPAGLGRAKTWWRPRLAPVLDRAFADELVIDCRSADYRAAWPGKPQSTVTIDVVQIRDGVRTVVSHFAKHTRGELVGRLLRTPEDLAQAASAWYEVELRASTARKPASLTVVLGGPAPG